MNSTNDDLIQCFLQPSVALRSLRSGLDTGFMGIRRYFFS